MQYRQMATGDLVQELSVLDAQIVSALNAYQQSPASEGPVWMDLLNAASAFRDAVSEELQSRKTAGIRLLGYNPDYVQDLKRRRPISAVFSALTGQAVRHGMARCPFGDDSNPSFSLSDAKGVFNCFKHPGESGDALELVRRVRRCAFREAVAWLEAL